MHKFLELLKNSAPATATALIATVVVAGVLTLLCCYVLVYVVYLRKKNGKLKKKEPKAEKLDLNRIMGYDFIKIIYPEKETKETATRNYEQSQGIGMVQTSVSAEPLVDNDTDAQFHEQPRETRPARPDPIESMIAKSEQSGSPQFNPEKDESQTPEVPQEEPQDNEGGNILYGMDSSEMTGPGWETNIENDFINGDPVFDEYIKNMSDDDDEETDDQNDEENQRLEQEAYNGLLQKMKDNHDMNIDDDPGLKEIIEAADN